MGNSYAYTYDPQYQQISIYISTSNLPKKMKVSSTDLGSQTDSIGFKTYSQIGYYSISIKDGDSYLIGPEKFNANSYLLTITF